MNQLEAERPSPLQRARQLMEFERGDIAVVAVYGFALGLLSLAVPIAVQSLVDTVMFGSILQPLVVLTVLLCAALISAACLRALRFRVVEMLQRRLFVRIACEIGSRLPRMNVGALTRARGPELINRFFDIFTTQKSIASLALGGLDAALVALIGLTVLAFYHPALLAFDIALIAAAWFVFVPLGRGGVNTSVAESRAKYAIAGWLEEMARQSFTLKRSGAAEFAIERVEDLAARYLQDRDEHFRVVYRQFVGALAVEIIASVVLLGLGGLLVIERQLTIGQLVAAELIVTAVVASLAKLGGKVEIFYDLMAAADKLGDILDLPLEQRQAYAELSPEERQGRVEVQELRLRDHVAGSRVTRSMAIEAGECVGIVADSEQETTAFANALFGLHEQFAGSIEIDGYDIRDLSLRELRKSVAVLRDIELLPGTILENLCAANPDLSIAQAWTALQRVGIARAIKQLPQGIQTEILSNGEPLTRSQALLLTLARLLAGEPSVVMIDRALDKLSRGARDEFCAPFLSSPGITRILVTDDSALQQACDRVEIWREHKDTEVAA